MSSTTISCRILGCLFLALLSQYADARKSHYMESILTSLQRVENMLVKQNEQNSLNCLVPAEKLYSLFSEHLTSSNESNETKSNGQNSIILRRALDLHKLPRRQKHRRKNKNRNENVNANINENINANINANRHHRRALDDDSYLSKSQNQNMNTNYNLNSNREDVFDFSDEDEV